MLGEQAPNGHQVNGNSTLCVCARAPLSCIFVCWARDRESERTKEKIDCFAKSRTFEFVQVNYGETSLLHFVHSHNRVAFRLPICRAHAPFFSFYSFLFHTARLPHGSSRSSLWQKHYPSAAKQSNKALYGEELNLLSRLLMLFRPRDARYSKFKSLVFSPPSKKGKNFY